MRKALLACAVLAGITLFTGCRNRAQDNMTIRPGVLRIGMDMTYPPFESLNAGSGIPVGFDVEMSRAISQKLGLEVQITKVAWMNLFENIKERKIDAAVSAISITDARLAAYSFSRPYLVNQIVIVTNKESGLDMQSPIDVAGLKVGFQASTTADTFMEDLRNHERLQFTARRYNSVMPAFEDLRNGNLDAVAVDLCVAGAYLNEENSPFLLAWTNNEMEFLGIAMRRGNDALTQAVDDALQQLFDDGTLKKLSARFLGSDMVSPAFAR
jgi:polar amino acid transport system substrate-binding protein